MTRRRAPRGDLAHRLLLVAVELVAEQGPEAMSLREVQRRAGVSAAAAYRHYQDREALLLAVGQHASALLADHLYTALGVPSGHAAASQPLGAAAVRLREACLAYLDFAWRRPNLFRAVFRLTEERPEQLQSPEPASRGSAGLGPYEILRNCLVELVETGLMPAKDLAWSDTAVMSATHGLAVLVLDGPLRHLDSDGRRAAAERLLDVVLQGLTGDAAPH